jgi:hypothetical protein
MVVEPASAQPPNPSPEKKLFQLLTKGSTPMFAQPAPYHSNQYRADPSCSHCAGVTTHEAWCSTHNVFVQYAFRAVLYNDLTVGDALILHALGVKWDRSLPDVSRHSRKAAQSSLLSSKCL